MWGNGNVLRAKSTTIDLNSKSKRMGQAASTEPAVIKNVDQPKSKIDILSLNEEIAIHIFAYLTPKELCIVSQVCKQLKAFSESNTIWKPIYEDSYSGVLIAPTIAADGKAVYTYKKYFALEKSHLSSKRRATKSQDGCCIGGSKSSPNQESSLRMANDMERQLREGAKLVLLGHSATGKTTLLLRLTKGVFNSHHEATIGASFLTKQVIVEDSIIKFQIWDTAGSERYYSLTPMYYRNAVAALVVYDVAVEDTFERAQKWVEELRAQCDTNPVIALAGNKCDLEKGRQVKKDKAKQWADEKGIIFMETSAKTGVNVAEIFLEIARKLKERSNSLNQRA